MITLKNEKQIEGIRRSGQLAAKTLIFASKLVKPGVSTQDINKAVHKFILDAKAIPAPLNYNGFPKSICTSINNVICHGIPSPQEILKEGDIVNIDITTILDGYYGDTSATYAVGKISPENQKFIDRTQESLQLAIKSIKPGKVLNDCVGKVIEKFLLPFGYGIVKELGGHGIGQKFHEDPFVFHYDIGRDDVILQPGMVFTVEPMITATSDARVTLDRQDHWTVRTRSGENSVQFEHTILVTNKGAEILTKL